MLVSGSMQQSAATTTTSDGSYVLLNLFANGLPFNVTVTYEEKLITKTAVAPILDDSAYYLDFSFSEGFSFSSNLSAVFHLASLAFRFFYFSIFCNDTFSLTFQIN